MVTIELSEIWLIVFSFIIGYGGASIIADILKLVLSIWQKKK